MKYEKGDWFAIAVEREYGTTEPLYSMTGGDGELTTVVTEKFLDSCERLLSVGSPHIGLRKTRGELLQAVEEELSPEELERLAKIKAQVPEVVEAAFARAEELRNEIMELERRYDDLAAWLNGEDPEEIARRRFHGE